MTQYSLAPPIYYMPNSQQQIVVLGAFDSKGAEYAYLIEQIHKQGGASLTVNFGVLGSTDRFPVDIEADEVARAGGGDLETLRTNRDRGTAMKIMAAGAAVIVRRL